MELQRAYTFKGMHFTCNSFFMRHEKGKHWQSAQSQNHSLDLSIAESFDTVTGTCMHVNIKQTATKKGCAKLHF